MDSAEYEMAPGVIVEFLFDVRRKPRSVPTASATRSCSGRRRGVPWVRFDNAHPIEQGGRRRKRILYHHWHRTTEDEGRPYAFTTSLELLDDFWQEVKRTLNEKGIPNDF